jgi:hypothetical protein
MSPRDDSPDCALMAERYPLARLVQLVEVPGGANAFDGTGLVCLTNARRSAVNATFGRTRLSEAMDLTETEVRELILTFWRLNAAKAPVADFMPILADGFALVATGPDGEEVARFDGLSGLEEHQAGKEVYFDQRFTLRSFEVELDSESAVARTTGLWECIHCEPGMAWSEPLKADLAHTWYACRSPESGQAVLTLHVCTYFQYVPGFEPAPPKDDGSSSREFHLDFDQHWAPGG